MLMSQQLMQRLALRIPDACRFCGTTTPIVPRYVVRGTVALVLWSCVACERQWSVTSEDVQHERRRELPDRRRATRTDRRK